MASSKRKTEIRQAPKNLDKMLFNNYREEERLQERLKDLTNNSRMRGIELDREKVQVFNELRLNKRRNSSPTIAPVVSRPASQRSPTTASSRPSTRQQTAGGALANRRRGSSANPVNEYLLSEFRRVSQVIPSILSSLNKDDNLAEGEEGEEGGGGGRRGRRKSSQGSQGTSLSSLTAPLVRLDPDLKAFAASKQAGGGDDDLNIGGIVSTIHSIKTLREDLAGKKRYDLSRAKTSFNDMLKHIHQEERRGSDSDTFTDGACVLLRRKMHKARRASCPAMDLNSTLPGGDQAPAHDASTGAAHPQRSLARSHTTLAAVGRQRTLDADSIRTLLKEEDKRMTQLKVATETRRYQDIRSRIDHFLHTYTPRRRCSLPVLSSHPEAAAENTT